MRVQEMDEGFARFRVYLPHLIIIVSDFWSIHEKFVSSVD